MVSLVSVIPLPPFFAPGASPKIRCDKLSLRYLDPDISTASIHRKSLGRRNMKIAFLLPRLSQSPITEMFFSYAEGARDILHIDVIIVTQKWHEDTSPEIIRAFHVFPLFFYDSPEELDALLAFQRVDYVYLLSVSHDDIIPTFCPSLVHSAVSGHPRGNRFAVISERLAEKYQRGLSVVPFFVPPLRTSHLELRQRLGIPNSAFVVATRGISRREMERIVEVRPDLHFFSVHCSDNPRIHRAPPDGPCFVEERMTILGMCDAFLQGTDEPLCLDLARFSSLGKPVILTSRCRDCSLYPEALLYYSSEEMQRILCSFHGGQKTPIYTISREEAMDRFEEVFLDCHVVTHHIFRLKGYYADDMTRLVSFKNIGWEPHISAAIEHILEEGDNSAVAIDVGAHIGWHTVHMSHKGAQVHAFEPFHLLYHLLRRNTERLDNVKHYQVALSTRRGSAKSTLGTWNLFEMSPRNLGDYSPAIGEVPAEFDVAALDDYSFSRLDLLKIDVVGHECSVLEGAHETIKRCLPTIIIPCDDSYLYKHGRSADELFRLLESMGYRALQIHSTYGQDYLCLHISALQRAIERWSIFIRPSRATVRRPGGLSLSIEFPPVASQRGTLIMDVKCPLSLPGSGLSVLYEDSDEKVPAPPHDQQVQLI